jgi:membrane protease YdiL (CAAX protease family)
MAAALVGAVGVGYAMHHVRRPAVPAMLRWLAVAFAPGLVLFVAAAATQGAPLPNVRTFLAAAAFSLLVQVPMSFVVEEVASRGALDSHAHHPGERHPWLSALLISALWGLWHLPIAGGGPLLAQIPMLVAIHGGIGVALSFAWRRTGNLAVPGVAHALADSLRNGLGLG